MVYVHYACGSDCLDDSTRLGLVAKLNLSHRLIQQKGTVSADTQTKASSFAGNVYPSIGRSVWLIPTDSDETATVTICSPL
jgi:hypothetical protein